VYDLLCFIVYNKQISSITEIINEKLAKKLVVLKNIK